MRIRLRMLMIAVASVALMLGGFVWHHRMRQLRGIYFSREIYYLWSILGSGESEPPSTAQEKWAVRMAEKYGRAARYPWLPVAPDEPEPR